jgi:transposase-like protein
MPAKRSWRRHSAEFKARVIELAGQSHASVAAVALANGLNANMLRRWVREAEGPAGAQVSPTAMTMSDAPAMPAFMPLPMLQERPALPTPSSPAPTDTTSAVFVELHRGDTSAYVSLPLNANSAAWLREVLA